MDEEVKVSISGIPYQVSVSARDHRWLADEPTDISGGDTGPNPGELLLSSLGSCTAITLTMYAQRKKWPLEGVEIDLRFNSAAKPDPKTTVIDYDIRFIGNLTDEQRARLMEISHSCPIHKVLTNPVIINAKED
ncbi:OsmC family protein [Chitinophaga sp. Mgbs1]|uniref:OsmC family protein n=1 Tax=Chitinophaga solisilvae TaxID=1233460 RepID=A0A3S1D5J1_9BACT|nr:OsmC family protein [Chitinophaga solisilvae]